ncbi:putative pheromone-regulated multispanning membrane protein [Erysiphe necator]|uniref:Plasma membrane fusion protein PRM1 n=1 Tax=Uncinula necator TaxID=52586 RepID=A0A0B1P9C1_UNCNE|nr:putative pheromone-regulated multispanning membrane protein [Erysiphe necator]
MTFESKFKSSFPAIPTSLNAGDLEMSGHDFFLNNPTLAQPHLGLRARLSQIFINRWTVLILLVLCRLLLAIRDINYNIEKAREESLEACTSVENVGSAMASMPHYLSKGINSLTAETITKTIDGLMDMMMDTLEIVSSIVLFVINMFTQTYACLITFAVTGSLTASIELIEKVGKFLNESIGPVTETLAGDTKKFQDGLNNFLKKIQLPAIFGKTIPVPTIDISGPIDSLRKIKIDPTVMNKELDKLNSSLPNFADVQKFTENVVKFPFNQLGKQINESKASYTFNHSIFPVAEKKRLTFCSDNQIINDFFNGIVTIISKARTLIIMVFTIVAVLLCVATAYKEIRTWNKLHDGSNSIFSHIESYQDLIYFFSRPHTSLLGVHMSIKLFSSKRRRNLLRWFVAYTTTAPALYVLSLGVAGLLSCLGQFILLKIVQKEVPVIADEVGKFTELVVKSLDDASKQWAIDANGVIYQTNMRINKDVFGWVQTGSEAINGTIDQFTNEMTKVLNVTFGGTILYKPILEVMNCLVGLKIASVQKGLTWVHDKAHVNIPEFKTDVFSLGAVASLATSNTSDTADSFLASTGDLTSDKITSAVTKVIAKLQDSILEEIMISSTLILIWVIYVLFGLSRVIFENLRRVKVHGEGGPPSYSEDKSEILKKNFYASSYSRYLPDFARSKVTSMNSRSRWSHDNENEKINEISDYPCVSKLKSLFTRSDRENDIFRGEII